MEIVGCDTSACIAIVWDEAMGKLFLSQVTGTPPNSEAKWAGEVTVEELERFIDAAKDGAFDDVLNMIRVEREARDGAKAQG